MATESLTESLLETLSVFDGSGEPRATSEVAERLGLGRRSTYSRLERLVERGRLETKKVGASARVWWLPTGSRGPGSTGDGTHRLFESLVLAVEEYAIFSLDPEGFVRSWNPGAERLKGYDAEEALGAHFSMFYTEDARAAGAPAENLETAAAEGSVTLEGWRVRKDGSCFYARVTIRAIRDADGELQGYAKVTHDMTDQRARERELRRERDLTERVFDTAPVRLAIFDADGTAERLNSASRRQFGIEDLDPAAMDLDHLPLYDAAGDPLDAADHPVSTVIDTGEAVSNRLIQHDTPDGERRWVTLTASPLFDDDGALERVVVAGKDVTDLKRTQRQLERQRDDLEHELADVFERIDDAFYALDEDFRFVYLNDYAAAMLGRSESELLGRSVWDALPVPDDAPVRERFETAMDRQEPTQFERYSEAADAWVEVRLYPSESGLSVYFRDVDEQKERERELELYETIVETMEDGIYVLDEEFRFARVNGAYAEMTGYDREELLGMHCSRVVSESVSEESAAMVQEMAAGTLDGGATLEADLHRADGGRLRAESNFTTLPETDDGHQRKVGVVRDVSDRWERERELERYETIFETMTDGVYVIDESDRFTMVNRAYAEMLGYTKAALLGSPASTVIDEETVDRAAELHRQMAAGERDAARLQTELTDANGDSFVADVTLELIDSESDSSQRVGVVRDVTERESRASELRRRVDQQEAVTHLGRRALETSDLDTLMNEAAAAVAETLGTDYAKVLDLDAEAEELLLRQGVGWDEGVVGSATVSAVDAASQAAYTLASREPVVVEEFERETRFSGPDLLTDHGVQSGISVVVGTYDDPWGVLGAHDTDSRSFSEQDVNFVQSVATILATAIRRHADERELLRHREQLAALNALNDIVREITDAVLNQSTREEIERTVCEHLLNSESYLFAWVGDVDATSRTVRVRTEVGVEGYLDDVTISVDPEDERSDGPTGRALRTGEMQTTRDVRTDERHAPWRDHARKHGFRSSAAIPLSHEGTTYGVLNVYAARPNAFEGPERVVVGQLGEVIGHAIAATERKRALLSDEVVELEFGIGDVFDALDIDATAGGTITLDDIVPLPDDEYLVYGTATADAVDSLWEVCHTIPHWDDVTIRETDGDPTNFELRLLKPPVLSAIASIGGSVERAVIEDGDYRMTVHVAPETDVRRITELVRETSPSAELLTRRQRPRGDGTLDSVRHVLAGELTDRQRTALDVAYHSGFFEWPRDVTGGDLAETLGVSPPTFHQHLRKAEKKLLDSLLSAPSTA